MSQFIHGKTDIYQSHLEILDSFLKEKQILSLHLIGDFFYYEFKKI